MPLNKETKPIKKEKHRKNINLKKKWMFERQ